MDSNILYKTFTRAFTFAFLSGKYFLEMITCRLITSVAVQLWLRSYRMLRERKRRG